MKGNHAKIMLVLGIGNNAGFLLPNVGKHSRILS